MLDWEKDGKIRRRIGRRIVGKEKGLLNREKVWRIGRRFGRCGKGL